MLVRQPQFNPFSSVPDTERQLLQAARQLEGLSLQALADANALMIPEQSQRAKGWIGTLLERHLGASAGNLSLPDFPRLGIELKTIPINSQKKPLESTYITVLNLLSENTHFFENTSLYQKLSKILWVPILTYDLNKREKIALSARRIVSPFLWSPSSSTWAVLKQDWEEIMAFVIQGNISALSGRVGTYLQIRPKAASSYSVTSSYDQTGKLKKTLPRGFYLRTALTREILDDAFR